MLLQRNSRNGRTRNDHRYFNADHLIVNQLTNANIRINIELNSISISTFVYIERLIINVRQTILGHSVGVDRSWRNIVGGRIPRDVKFLEKGNTKTFDFMFYVF